MEEDDDAIDGDGDGDGDGDNDGGDDEKWDDGWSESEPHQKPMNNDSPADNEATTIEQFLKRNKIPDIVFVFIHNRKPMKYFWKLYEWMWNYEVLR